MLSFYGNKVERLISKNVDIEILVWLYLESIAFSAIGIIMGKNKVQALKDDRGSGWTSRKALKILY
jgi:hypothetical protein